MNYFLTILSIFFAFQTSFGQAMKDCRRTPQYVSKLGYDVQKSGFSSSERFYRGLCFVEFSQDGKNKVYQHKSWTKAGFIGPILVLENGEIITAPTPSVNILYNKPEEQNFLYKVDANTQEMKKAVALPFATPPNKENPFGLIGLAYDCDTKIIYASSLAGSTRQKENGRIFAIKSTDYQIIAMIENTDCMGIGIGFVNGEKRLLMGKTRNSEVLSVALNEDGSFKGVARKELSLDGLGPRGDDVARKIRFLPDGSLQIQAVEFYYNLIAPTEKQETRYVFKQNKDKWFLTQVD